MLELVAASVILAATLVPALRMMRDAMTMSREIQTMNLMSTFAVDVMEQHLAETEAVWATTDTSGDFASEGYANLNYQVTRSDATTDGGIPGQLMTIEAQVWNDVDGDDSVGAAEPSVSFHSKLAQMAGYSP